MTSPQIPLGLRFPAHQRFESYIGEENAVAVAALRHSLDAVQERVERVS